MDRALSISWYDLPQGSRDAYLDWLHGSYIPKILREPGILWAAHYKTVESEKPLPRLRHTNDASIPTGNGYVLMFGAKDAHAFASLTPYKLKVSASEKEMLGMRVGERLNIYTEEARVDGPDAGKRDGEFTPAPCIQLGSFNSGAYEDEDELLSWYAHFRLPSMQTMPGSIGLRKLVSVSGWAKHGVMYEFVSLEERAKHFRAHETRDPKLAAWSAEVVEKLVHAPGSPVVAQRIWPPIPDR